MILSPPFPFLLPPLPMHGSFFSFCYTYFLSLCPPHLPSAPPASVWVEEGEKRVRGKVSLRKTRIERRWERWGAEGFAEMGTVCLFAGGCCYSPFPACSICIRSEVLYMCRSLCKLCLICFCSFSFYQTSPRKMRPCSHNKEINPISQFFKDFSATCSCYFWNGATIL